MEDTYTTLSLNLVSYLRIRGFRPFAAVSAAGPRSLVRHFADSDGFHDLRHTSATHELANGGNVKVVAERLGHSSAKMTLDVYAHAVPTLQKESAKKMAELFLN